MRFDLKLQILGQSPVSLHFFSQIAVTVGFHIFKHFVKSIAHLVKLENIAIIFHLQINLSMRDPIHALCH